MVCDLINSAKVLCVKTVNPRKVQQWSLIAKTTFFDSRKQNGPEITIILTNLCKMCANEKLKLYKNMIKPSSDGIIVLKIVQTVSPFNIGCRIRKIYKKCDNIKNIHSCVIDCHDKELVRLRSENYKLKHELENVKSVVNDISSKLVSLYRQINLLDLNPNKNTYFRPINSVCETFKESYLLDFKRDNNLKYMFDGKYLLTIGITAIFKIRVIPDFYICIFKNGICLKRIRKGYDITPYIENEINCSTVLDMLPSDKFKICFRKDIHEKDTDLIILMSSYYSLNKII